MTQPATILLVEDDQSMLDGMRDLLQIVDIGYDIQVLTASNGYLGLQLVAEHTPDLIVSDVMMPQMDGYQFLRRVRQNTAWIHIPFIFLTAKGEKRDVHKGRISGADLYITKPFNSGEFLELIKSQLDRSFQLQATRQQSITNLKKDILQILNHEFRTPLTYVTAYYEMLADSVARFEEGDNFQEYLRGIQVGCIRLTRLVEDFIQVIELRTGEIDKRLKRRARELDNIDDLLDKAVHDNQAKAAEHRVEIEYMPAAELPSIWGDETSLLNIFNRLLDNAIKFTRSYRRSGGKVVVSTRATDQTVEIVIRDEGMGFPEHVYDRLFELFFQYNRGMFEQQGTGIGLTIVKELVHLHQGTIKVDSQEGVGSTFTVILPVYPGASNYHPSLTSWEVRQPATVLIVEDDRHLLAGLQELLEIYNGRYELHVLTASNGRQGLQTLSRRQPDLIISDIMMPEMDGYQFLGEVRQNPNWLHIPFIFLTAKGERRDIHHGRRIGAEEYITKPYDSDELLDLITIQLDRYFQIQNVLTQNLDGLKKSILDLITPDFRLPLSIVTQYADKLVSGLEEVQTDEELKQSLLGIQDASLRLTRLVEDFISLAEIKTGEAATAYNLRAQPIDNVGLLLVDAVEAHFSQVREAGVEIQKAIPPTLPVVYGVSTLILDCLQRLLDISLNYCRQSETRQITLSAGPENSDVHLTICFSMRMENEALNLLADLFTGQQHGTILTKMETNARIVKEYVGLHNGRVHFTSTENSGIFTLILPVYQPQRADSGDLPSAGSAH